MNKSYYVAKKNLPSLVLMFASGGAFAFAVPAKDEIKQHDTPRTACRAV